MVTDARLTTVQRDGLCGKVAPDDPRWHTVAVGLAAEAEAAELWKTVCSECPVWQMCLSYAIDADERGIWSGTTEARRARMRRAAVG